MNTIDRKGKAPHCALCLFLGLFSGLAQAGMSFGAGSAPYRYQHTATNPGGLQFRPLPQNNAQGVRPAPLMPVSTASQIFSSWPALYPNNASVQYGGVHRYVSPRIEAQLNKTSAYENETLLLTLRVVSDVNLKTATPQLPQSDNLMIQKIEGPNTSARTTRSGKREIVNEFVFAVSPLVAGDIAVPPIHITGTLASLPHQGYGRRAASRHFDVASPKGLELHTKPAATNIQPWLPLEQLELKAHFDERTVPVAGKPLTLIVEISAVGASGAQLPSVETLLQSQDFRVYREKTRTSGKLSADGKHLLGTRTEYYTLIPQYGGRLHLPPVRLAWWNVKTGTQEYSAIPIHALSATGGLRGKGELGLTRPTTLFPAGSPLAFWIPLAGMIGLLSGFWMAAWWRARKAPHKWPFPRIRMRALRIPLPKLSVGGPMGKAAKRLRRVVSVVNPLPWGRRLRQRMVTALPTSVRFWFCVRCIDNEKDPEHWGQTLKFLACKHLDLSPYASLPRVAERIIEFQPKSDPARVRALVKKLEGAVYGHETLDFEDWKREFKRQVRPRLIPFRRHAGKRGKTDDRLPELNPRQAA